MGKGNRNRVQRLLDDKNVNSSTKTKENKSSRNWVAIIVSLLLVALIVTVSVVNFISSSGIELRSKKVLTSENYEVDGAMMSYFFNNYYNSYQQYIQNSFGEYASYLLPSSNKSLKEQKYDDETTWYDFLMDATVKQVKESLIYCEAALDAGVQLDKEDKESISNEISAIKQIAEAYGYTKTSYISMVYGVGVKEKDIRNALEISLLCEKYAETIYENCESEVVEADITKYFTDNLSSFVKADYLTYEFKADIKTVVEADYEDTAAYEAALAEATAANEAAIKAAKENAEKLAACTTVEEFNKALAEYMFDAKYQHYYDIYYEELDESVANDDAAKQAIKEAVYKNVMNELFGTDAAAESENANTQKVITSIKAGIVTDTNKAITDSAKKAVAYAVSNDFEKWLFGNTATIFGVEVEDIEASDCAVGKTYVYENNPEDGKSYSATAYYVTATPYRYEESRNIGHILFTEDTYKTKEAAQQKAQEILEQFDALPAEQKTKEKFEELGKDLTDDSGIFYENVAPGQMVAEFNDWMFDDAREVGDTGLVETQYGYHVMYYMGVGEQIPWHENSRLGAVDTKVQEWVEENGKIYVVNVDTKLTADLFD